jgi:Tfp pilus assembly protein PilP
MAMKLTTGILAMAMMAGVAGARNPNTTDPQQVPKSQAQQAATGGSVAKPAPGAPAKTQPAPAMAAKPATAPGAKQANAAKPTVKPAVAPASAAKPAVKGAAAPGAKTPAAKAVFAARPPAQKPTPKALPAPATAKVAGKGPKPAAPVADPKQKSDPRKSADGGRTADATKQAKPEEKKWSMTGKRDPFFSPVVSQTGGSGCSTGKKCLEIGQINLRGVVKSENGFIAVVTNTLNKAYFLREKDPVFNGYVVRITGDSVVFQETVQDKLGKAFTREVVKRIFTPAV